MKRPSWSFILSLVVLAGLSCVLWIASRPGYCSRGFPEPTAHRTVDRISGAMRGYYVEYSRWPTGTQAQITATLLNCDEHNLGFLDLKDPPRNAHGELLDPWKTPYHITTTGTNITSSSAGPDRKFGTPDDIVAP